MLDRKWILNLLSLTSKCRDLVSGNLLTECLLYTHCLCTTKCFRSSFASFSVLRYSACLHILRGDSLLRHGH